MDTIQRKGWNRGIGTRLAWAFASVAAVAVFMAAFLLALIVDISKLGELRCNSG